MSIQEVQTNKPGPPRRKREDNPRDLPGKSRHSNFRVLFAAVAQLASIVTTFSQYSGWQHSGSLWIITTPEGANLRATAAVADFPLLVRLDQQTFDFSEARADGADLCFSAGGLPLAYEIDEWNSAKGTASLWVRIPLIRGNEQQEIKMHWGKADAKTESKGSAVFNESNGFLSVLHFRGQPDSMNDAVGTLAPENTGTTEAAGRIGQGRHFDIGRGLKCGENITRYPSGSAPNSSEAWIRAERVNGTILGWGNEEAQGKVVMQLASPPHLRMDCYFSGANISSTNRLPMAQWVHVAHTCERGNSRLYVNGKLAGVATSTGAPLAIKSPAKMWIGGWYNNFQFVGDMDEVRISKAARSEDWIQLEYENQKANQTLVGTLPQPGDNFGVSPDRITVEEGGKLEVTAWAGGAEKVYWMVKGLDPGTVVASDRFSYTVNAGRVSGDTNYVLQFKAVYAHEVRTRDIPVTIKETIPEPVVVLKAPARWNGRDLIEVVPEIKNLEAMTRKGAGEWRCAWNVAGGAVIKEVREGKLLLLRSQGRGPITVIATLDNGGAPSVVSQTILVSEPKHDPWVRRIPDQDERPEDNQFFARDDQNESTLYYNGTLSNVVDRVFLRLYADHRLIQTQYRKLGADRRVAFTTKLKPGLIKYAVEFGTRTGQEERLVHTATNLVCGDAYLIDGQSNALATDTGEQSPAETNDWIRSYGSPIEEPAGSHHNLWCNPVWKAQKGEKAELGYWGMELAKRLVESQQIPIFIVNGAVGGTRIDQHQRSESNPTDGNTIYGRLLWRIQRARLTHGIRAVIWHQGESDQGSDGPTGGYGWESYQHYFVEMSAAWKQDFPNIQHYYVFQIWPNACSMGNGHGDMLREVQRTLPRLYSHLDVMSTLGIQPGGECHYPLIGWAEFARLLQPLIERDLYGKQPAASITAPNLKRAYYATDSRNVITLEFDQPVVWHDSLASQFYPDGQSGKVLSGIASGNCVLLELKEPATAEKISYLKEMSWSSKLLLRGANGIAALTFCDVPVSSFSRLPH
jgi:hypothetical protein